MVVDDNRNILASVRILLSNVFNNVVTLASPANMLSAIRENRINVVLLDMNFASGINNGNEGFFWLQEINRHNAAVRHATFVIEKNEINV